MRIMPIRQYSSGQSSQLKLSFAKNKIHYLREAAGLGIFMTSACFFSAMLFSANNILPGLSADGKNWLMALLMGSTALFIFYSPWTAPSGSHINPAVTLSFWRLGKMCRYDALFFIIAQFAGGLITVYLMQWLLGDRLLAPPVKSAITIPGRFGANAAFWMEICIAFVTMLTVLITSHHRVICRFTRFFSAILVFTWVITAGPVSGFGMNPARSFASALPANVWTGFWIYLVAPIAGMLLATELFILTHKKSKFLRGHSPMAQTQ